jgi:preprotein translocase subunit SecD
MNRSLIIIGTASLLLLAACTQETTLKYDVKLRAPDAAKAMILAEAVERVMIRKMTAQSIEKPMVTVVPNGSGSALLTIDVPDENTAAMIRSLVDENFTFDLRIEDAAKGGQEDKFDPARWQPVGITGALVTWVQAVGNSRTNEIGVDLTFNQTGQERLRKIFKENVGKNIGIFVRELLVSKMNIVSPDIGETLSISGVPSAAIAEVFADDVDVGLLTVAQEIR